MSTDRTALSDLAVATLRTVVPVAWGTLVAQVLAWLAPHLTPALADALTAWLSAETAIALVTMVAIAIWYALWRRLEHLVPDWLVRLVLGSARVPAYPLPLTDLETHADAVAALYDPTPGVYTELTDDERTQLGALLTDFEALDPSQPIATGLRRLLLT